MSNCFGNIIKLEIFGESHAMYCGVILDGMIPGIKIDNELIDNELKRRRPTSIDTPRIENDHYEFIGGINNGYTTGEPICILVSNNNYDDTPYKDNSYLARPSHADYTNYVKSNGFASLIGGGSFSGRLTAPIVIAGAICRMALKEFNIIIGTHIKQIGNICDSSYNNEDITKWNKELYPTIDNIGEELIKEILKAKDNDDSVGGILETVCLNVPCGIGEPWFDSLESKISHGIFSIGGVKGIEFGKGFAFANSYGSTSNDNFIIENDLVKTSTNNNGGINGGISNGMPIIFRTVIKPTPSIGKMQSLLDLKNNCIVDKKLEGKFDSCIVRRIIPVVEAITAFVILDSLLLFKASHK